MPEIVSTNAASLALGLDKIKVNTLYLRAEEAHKEALKCLEHLLQLNMQYDKLGSYRLRLKYRRLTEELAKINNEIISTVIVTVL